jgi:Zn-dependent M28 family amino/carboxypeptidase
MVATAQQLRDAALLGTGAFDLVRSLTTEVGPRFAGSPGDAAAVRWGAETMRALGFANVRAEPVKVPHWKRGAEAGEILTPYPQPVVLTALGGSPATPAGGLEGAILEVESLAAMAALTPEAVAGKIVFYSSTMQRSNDGSGYGAVVGIRGQGVAKAAEKGAIAVLIRSVSTASNRLPHTGAARTQAGWPPIPCAALSVPDAELLQRQVASGRPVRFRLRLDTQQLPESDSANVIGDVAGGELAHEVVLLGCHLDSWDLGTGAEDDAAGCAVVLETGRRLLALKQRPRRTVRVVLFANEEFGLSGGRAYAEAHKAEIGQHVLAAEADLGSGKILRFASRVRAEALPWIERLAELLQPLGIERRGNEARGGADLIPLAAAGVPLADLDPDATRYFDVHHSANDTLDKVDAKGLDQAVAAYLVLAMFAAEAPVPLGPVEPPGPRR